jgi:hypothetical protein
VWDAEGRAHRGEEMRIGGKWQAERARRGVPGIYMLAVISVIVDSLETICRLGRLTGDGVMD